MLHKLIAHKLDVAPKYASKSIYTLHTSTFLDVTNSLLRMIKANIKK
jgi:hypothetical protein